MISKDVAKISCRETLFNKAVIVYIVTLCWALCSVLFNILSH